MISGFNALDAARDDARERRDTELFRLGLAHHDHGRGAVVQRAGVARGDRSVRTEHRLQRRELLDRGAGAGAVVLRDDRAVGRRDGRDLTIEVAVPLGLDRTLLRAGAPLVHLLARHALGLDDVLRGLSHRDVDVGEAGGRRPRRLAALGALLRAGARRLELLVRAAAVGRAEAEPADRLDAAGDEHVALAGLDRVRGHANGLQRRRAVAVDGHARHVDTGDDRGDAGDVEARFAGGLTAAPDDVLDLRGVERRHLVEHRSDDQRRQVVGTAVDERTLVRAPDRRAGGRDDDGFGHDGLRGVLLRQRD